MSVLDLPIDEQQKCAKLCGYDSLEAWQEDMRAELEENARLREMEDDLPTKAEIAELIHDLKTNPNALYFYQRVSGDYDLTAEEVIRDLENEETID
ncbi:hypothetical protein [Basilea psittacipulmonis]|uniref:Uncharacterized protein n=1 Tax=Basilea psittacipulmonis DSM 24701 TaxID=1072685 RepID=A0A077DE52_9BURK|nr:hypothetical protein [Basilea psittacipulmonis]AIL32421.1 hypothetical protein IX83_03045 [Basilea psittacipulmonis DSM 24701]